MDADKLDTTTLLKHDPRYGVLVCLECRYAIRRSALDSHLLRHKIYREERKRLVASMSHLNVLEPGEVPLPAPTSPAIENLTKFGGLRCMVLACAHLTVSMKRMQHHWKQAHPSATLATELPSLISHVTLQTFFRGNKIRYFEVESTRTWTGDNAESSDAACYDLSNRDRDSRGAHSTCAETLPTASVGRSINTSNLARGLDMRLVNYFHHFVTSTSNTLPFSTDSPLQERYWREVVVSKALQYSRMMYGILAISACHMALSTEDPSERQVHYEYEAKYASNFDSLTEAAAPDETVEQMYVHLRSILHMAQLVHESSHAGATGITRQCSISVSLRDCLSLENIRQTLPHFIYAGAVVESGLNHTVVDGPVNGLRTLQ